MKKRLIAASMLVVLALAAGCNSGGSKPAAEEPKKAPETELATGREAFQKLYMSARGWAGDARPYRLQSLNPSDSDGHDGKAAVWSAGFASPSRRTIRVFTWSGSKDPNAPSRGVSANVEDTYSPNNAATAIFDIAFLKSDSDKAYSEAQAHGGEKLLKKDPKQPVVYVLTWTPSENALLWHVMYGTGETDAKLKIEVDATKGTFTRVEH